MVIVFGGKNGISSQRLASNLHILALPPTFGEIGQEYGKKIFVSNFHPNLFSHTALRIFEQTRASVGNGWKICSSFTVTDSLKVLSFAFSAQEIVPIH